MSLDLKDEIEIATVAEKIRAAVPAEWNCVTIIEHPSGLTIVANVPDENARELARFWLDTCDRSPDQSIKLGRGDA